MWATPPRRAARSYTTTPAHEPSRVRSWVGAEATAHRPIGTDTTCGGSGRGAVDTVGVSGSLRPGERRGERLQRLAAGDEQQRPVQLHALRLEPGPREDQPVEPDRRFVNSKRVSLTYELKEVGPSGAPYLELWFTQDGRSWNVRRGYWGRGRLGYAFRALRRVRWVNAPNRGRGAPGASR